MNHFTCLTSPPAPLTVIPEFLTGATYLKAHPWRSGHISLIQIMKCVAVFAAVVLAVVAAQEADWSGNCYFSGNLLGSGFRVQFLGSITAGFLKNSGRE